MREQRRDADYRARDTHRDRAERHRRVLGVADRCALTLATSERRAAQGVAGPLDADGALTRLPGAAGSPVDGAKNFSNVQVLADGSAAARSAVANA